MKRLLLFLAAIGLHAADPATPASMEASLAQQRQSIEKQLRALGQASFFLLPGPQPLAVAPGAPDCDPLPETQVNALVEEAAKKESLKPELLRAVIRQESGSRPCAVSVKGAQGLMQLMPATVEEFAVEDAFDPRQNVRAGAKYLKQLLLRYGGDVAKALAAYNAGPVRVDRAGGVPSIPETLNYVSSILAALPIR